MNVYRHRNGSGQKYFPAQASPDSFLYRNATVEGESNLYGCSVEDAAVKDTFAADSCLHANVTAADCRLSRAHVYNSDLVRSDVVGATVSGCRLTDCKVFSDGDYRPRLYNVRLVGVRVFGQVEMVGPWGLELEGAHIHAGKWMEPPRSVHISGENGVSVAVVECTEGRAHMGCDCRPVEEWLKRGPRFGRRLGWTAVQIERCAEFLEGLR